MVSITTKSTPSSTGTVSKSRRRTKISMGQTGADRASMRPSDPPRRGRRLVAVRRPRGFTGATRARCASLYLSIQVFQRPRLYSTGWMTYPLTFDRVMTISLVL